jgi:adenine-specific DNA-methyltransferase
VGESSSEIGGKVGAERPQLSLPLSAIARRFEGSMDSVTTAVRQKELGAFYTPPAIAEKLATWALRSAHDKVLDPSFGGLAFLVASAKRLEELGQQQRATGRQLFGIDLDPLALETAQTDNQLTVARENLVLSDFFDVDPGQLPPVDALLGNPPYIRYQGFNGAAHRAREHAAAAGVELTRLASSWAPFVVHGASFIAPGGRMGQVLPAELLHTQYATEVLEFLRRRFGHVALAVFEERVFPGALEEVVLLFADDYGAQALADVQLISCQNVADLDLGLVEATCAVKSPSSKPRAGRQKLLSQLLPRSTQDLVSRLSGHDAVRELGTVASVDIGVVTGANNFFVLPQSEADQIDASLLRPAVSKAAHVRGAELTKSDHASLLASGAPGLMLVADRSSREVALNSARGHIRAGERSGVHERYKCRIRDPWWALAIPKTGVPDLLLTYCSSQYPRMALNTAGALNTNTLHGVTVLSNVDPAAVAAVFFNSLTLLSAELVGRSYGGGVLKLEPTEAEALLLPPVSTELSSLLPAVDRAIRTRDLSAALDLVDPIVLEGALGLDGDAIEELRQGRERLRSRRERRGKPAH